MGLNSDNYKVTTYIIRQWGLTVANPLGVDYGIDAVLPGGKRPISIEGATRKKITTRRLHLGLFR